MRLHRLLNVTALCLDRVNARSSTSHNPGWLVVFNYLSTLNWTKVMEGMNFGLHPTIINLQPFEENSRKSSRNFSKKKVPLKRLVL